MARIEHSEGASPGYVLTDLWRLEDICGTAERAPALAYLVEMIVKSQRALWGLDFPFGLPIELMKPGAKWPAQLDFVKSWNGNAHTFGLECLNRAKALGGPNHIRRLSDIEARTPFDTYHYRIIYQTFYGMRDVLDPLRRKKGTAILPFQYHRLPSAGRVVVEACPSSTLKRLGLPYQNYKQPGGRPLEAKHLWTRKILLSGFKKHVRISGAHRSTIIQNSGGDALDAVIAAIGTLRGWQTSDHRKIAGHPRYPREGRLYI